MTIQTPINLKTNHDSIAYFYGSFEPEQSEKGKKVFDFFCGFLRLCGGQFTCSFDESSSEQTIQWKIKVLDEQTKKVANLWVAFNSTYTLNGYECFEDDSHEHLERTLITSQNMMTDTFSKSHKLDPSRVKVIEKNDLMDLIDLRSKNLKDKIKSFNDFYIFYLQEHSKQGTRFWHMVGTASAVTFTGLGLFTSGWFLLLAPIAGYVPAWVSHFKIEENKPATWLGIKEIFKSLGCDFIMSGNNIRGVLSEDLRLSGINPNKK